MITFNEYWTELTKGSTQWTTLERLAAKDAFEYVQRSIDNWISVEEIGKERIKWENLYHQQRKDRI